MWVVSRYIKLYRGEKQNGWECFDIALSTSRQALYDYAIQHKGEEAYRRLLAPEIRHATALTAIYLDQEDEKNRNVSELLVLARASDDSDYLDQIESKIIQQLAKVVVPEQDMLPECLQEKANHIMCRVHDSYRAANNAKAQAEKEGYDNIALNKAYISADLEREAADQALKDFSESEEVYEAYVKNQYDPAKKKWAAFQRQFAGEDSTSMVDIVARMLNRTIVIMQEDPQTREKKVIYETTFKGAHKRHILYNGVNHFVGLYRVGSDSQKEASSTFSAKPTDQIMEFLKKKGEEKVGWLGEYGETAMHWAAYRGKEDLIVKLEEVGLSVNDQDDYEGKTPLHWAAQKTHDAVYRRLVELGAREDIQDKAGKTPKDCMPLDMLSRIFEDMHIGSPIGTSTPKKDKKKSEQQTPPISPIELEGHSSFLHQDSLEAVNNSQDKDSFTTFMDGLKQSKTQYTEEIENGDYSNVLQLQKLLFRLGDKVSKSKTALTFAEEVEGKKLSRSKVSTKNSSVDWAKQDIAHMKVHPKGWALCYQTSKPGKAAKLASETVLGSLEKSKQRVTDFLSTSKDVKPAVKKQLEQEQKNEKAKYKQALGKDKVDNLPNFVVAEVCFFVSNKVHGQHTKYEVVTIPVKLAAGDKALLSRDSEDGIFLNAEDFWQQVQAQHKQGALVLKRDLRPALDRLAAKLEESLTSLKYVAIDDDQRKRINKKLERINKLLEKNGVITKEILGQLNDTVLLEDIYKAEVELSPESQKDQRYAHSERVFFRALERDDTIEYLYKELAKKVMQKNIVSENAEGKVKVYSMAVLMESYPNTVCERCTVSAVGVQHSYQEGGFLSNIMKRFNQENSIFKTRGWEDNGKQDDKHKEADATRFKCLMVVGASKPFQDIRMQRLFGSPDDYSIDFGDDGVNVHAFPTDQAFIEHFNSKDTSANKVDKKQDAKGEKKEATTEVKTPLVLHRPTICVSGSRSAII